MFTSIFEVVARVKRCRKRKAQAIINAEKTKKEVKASALKRVNLKAKRHRIFKQILEETNA